MDPAIIRLEDGVYSSKLYVNECQKVDGEKKKLKWATRNLSEIMNLEVIASNIRVFFS